MRLAKNIRSLSSQEKATAFSVFLNTIDYDLVRITDGLGADDRKFTFPGTPLSKGGIASKAVQLVFGGPASAILDRIVYINFGPDYYANALGESATFIHEMTHAWQYMHGINVALDSLSKQATYGDDAYEYEPGIAWNLYNVEQQAHIVEDWFIAINASGATPETNIHHPNYIYIRDNIRANQAR